MPKDNTPTPKEVVKPIQVSVDNDIPSIPSLPSPPKLEDLMPPPPTEVEALPAAEEPIPSLPVDSEVLPVPEKLSLAYLLERFKQKVQIRNYGEKKIYYISSCRNSSAKNP